MKLEHIDIEQCNKKGEFFSELTDMSASRARQLDIRYPMEWTKRAVRNMSLQNYSIQSIIQRYSLNG